MCDICGATFVGWWEEYLCGCISKTIKHQKNLTGYCGTHGDDRIAIGALYSPVGEEDAVVE